jgi:hypothetical protein
MPRLVRLAFLIAAEALSAHAASNLLEYSPFLPPSVAAQTSIQEPSQLELRSIVLENGQREFSLYDTAKKQSTWARLNESGHDFLIRNYNAATETVTVEKGSCFVVLTLKEAGIGLANVESKPMPVDELDAAPPSSPFPLSVQPLSTAQLNALVIFRTQEELQQIREGKGRPPNP